MKISGMGWAILRVTAEQLRELHTVPTDVVFERTVAQMSSAFQNYFPRDWCHDEHPFYFRIQHKYLPRVNDRGPLLVFSLSELLRQYEDMKETERENRGKPVPPDSYGPWVNDDE
jgi:hypothetical protein